MPPFISSPWEGWGVILGTPYPGLGGVSALDGGQMGWGHQDRGSPSSPLSSQGPHPHPLAG